VEATVGVRTSVGRTFVWAQHAVASPDGTAELRVPYPTGAGGPVAAGPCRVVSGGEAREIAIPHAAVATGARVSVELGR
jgi:hypothetical protein